MPLLKSTTSQRRPQSLSTAARRQRSAAVPTALSSMPLWAGLSNWIVAACVKRMTAAEPFCAEPDAAKEAVSLYRLHHVLGAGRVETASGRQPRRNPPLVHAQQSDHDPHRAKTFSTSPSNVSNGTDSAALRGLKTTSHPGGRRSSRSRAASRIRRLMRFRRTDLPSARGTVSPMRETLPPGRFRQNTAKHCPAILKPRS